MSRRVLRVALWCGGLLCGGSCSSSTIGTGGGDLAGVAERADLASLDLTIGPDLSPPPTYGQAPDSTVSCGTKGSPCVAPTSACCKGGPVAAGTCIAPGQACTMQVWLCDDRGDCLDPGNVCCITSTGSRCSKPSDCLAVHGKDACQLDADCDQGQRCCGVGPSPAYYCSASACPISRRRFKSDIHYLDADEEARLAEQLLGYPLTTYRYTGDPQATPHLGFVIDDVLAGGAASPAVAPGGQTVDLYGYTSMAVAALKQQARQIEELSRQVRALRAELARRPREQRPRTR